MARKSTNQVVVNQVFKMVDPSTKKTTFNAFISLISLDYVSSDQGLDKIVQSHPITYERASTNGYGIETSRDFHFAPTVLSLN